MHRRGFTIIELSIVLTITVLLAGIAIPQFFRARQSAREAACGQNRAALDVVKELAMIELGLGHEDEMEMDELVPEHLESVPECDGDGVYTLNSLGEPSECSIHGDPEPEPA